MAGAVTDALSDNQLANLTTNLFVNLNDSFAQHNWLYTVEFFGGNMSTVHGVPAGATSFAHRDKLLSHQFYTREFPNISFRDSQVLMTQFADCVRGPFKDTSWGMYVNYLDMEVGASSATSLYWRDGVSQLKTIKARVDPRDIFWSPHGIRPGGSNG